MRNSERPITPILDLNEDKSGLIGLTKREYFAGLAMQGIIASRQSLNIVSLGSYRKAYAKESIELADELLKQLDETNKH